MQGHSCRTTYRLLHGEDRSEARMSSVTTLIPARHRLDHEKDYNKLQKWDPVDTLEPVGGTGLCGWPRLLSHSHQQMQEKTELLNTVSTQLGLDINEARQRLWKPTQRTTTPLHWMESHWKRQTQFTYIGSTINKNGGTEEDVKARIQKARVAFIMLRTIWKAKQIKTNTKLRIFNWNVKAVLLYGSETWQSTQKTLKIIQTFINKCLRRILHLKWTDKVPNTTLWKITKQLPIENEIKKRKWRWIGHTLRKPPETITWNPHGRSEEVGHETPGKETRK